VYTDLSVRGDGVVQAISLTGAQFPVLAAPSSTTPSPNCSKAGFRRWRVSSSGAKLGEVSIQENACNVYWPGSNAILIERNAFGLEVPEARVGLAL
jgi:hypothetical protein